MMHLNVEPDTRNGINLMKFVVNHPYKFKGYRTKDENGNDVIHFNKVVAPFMLGFL